MLVVFFVSGCAHNLDPAGVYKGDTVLYETDNTLGSAHDILQDFVNWEYSYRDTLAAIPGIRTAADRIFEQGPKWFASAWALRETYAQNPTEDNRQKLLAAMEILRTAVREASGYMTSETVPPETRQNPKVVNRARRPSAPGAPIVPVPVH